MDTHKITRGFSNQKKKTEVEVWGDQEKKKEETKTVDILGQTSLSGPIDDDTRHLRCPTDKLKRWFESRLT